MPKTLYILDNDFHMYFLYQPLFLNKQTENDVLYFRTPWGSLIYINDSSIRQFYVLLLSILRSHHMRIFYQIGNWTVFHGVFTGTKRKNRGCWISLWSIRTNWKWRWSFKASIQSLKNHLILLLTEMLIIWTFQYSMTRSGQDYVAKA